MRGLLLAILKTEKLEWNLILNPSYTGDQGIRVTALAFDTIQSVQKRLEEICIVHSCLYFEPSECNATLKISQTERKIPSWQRSTVPR